MQRIFKNPHGLVGVAFTVTVLVGLYACWQQLSTNGLDKLSSATCRGAVSVDAVRQVLKDTQQTNVKYSETDPGSSFRSTCSIFTAEKAGFVVEAEVQDTVVTDWREWNESQGKGQSVYFEDGEGAISFPRRTNVYIACDPHRAAADIPVGEYALLVINCTGGSSSCGVQD